jgi:hypothetical protein
MGQHTYALARLFCFPSLSAVPWTAWPAGLHTPQRTPVEQHWVPDECPGERRLHTYQLVFQSIIRHGGSSSSRSCGVPPAACIAALRFTALPLLSAAPCSCVSRRPAADGSVAMHHGACLAAAGFASFSAVPNVPWPVWPGGPAHPEMHPSSKAASIPGQRGCA